MKFLSDLLVIGVSIKIAFSIMAHARSISPNSYGFLECYEAVKNIEQIGSVLAVVFLANRRGS